MAYHANDPYAPSTTRREFLALAGVAGVSLIKPSALFAAPGAVKPQTILVPSSAHPAFASAAKILAKKLKLDEAAVRTYDGAAKPTSGAIVLALAKDGKLPAAEMPRHDGYTVTYTGGTVVWGARPRSILFAAGEPHHWAEARTLPYRRNPDFALRNSIVARELSGGGSGRDVRRKLLHRAHRGRARAEARPRCLQPADAGAAEEYGRCCSRAQGRKRGAGEGVPRRGCRGVCAAALWQQLCDVVARAVCGDDQGVSDGRRERRWRTRTSRPRCARATR